MIRFARFAALLLLAIVAPVHAQAPAPVTTKLADNVYMIRNAGYQSLFVVGPDAVLVTDPSGLNKPQAAPAYLAEIRKITQAPIKYVVYSHHHYDHIAGGQPFKEAGATVIAHRNAKTRLEALKHSQVVIPDETVDDRRSIDVGGTRVDLVYVGRNHSDSMLVVHLPKEKLIWAVDFIPVDGIEFRDMPDGYVPDWFDSLDRVLALDWDRLVTGHPTPGNKIGTKDDVRAQKQYLTDLSDLAKDMAGKGQCFNDEAMRSARLPKYEKWADYDRFLFGNIERFCEYWARGA